MDIRVSTGLQSELLKRVSHGDEEAFRELYDITHKKVFFYLYRLLQDRDTAEDILIETFTEVWKGAKNYEGRAQVRTWILAIARNRAMKELRKRRVHQRKNIDDYPHLTDGDMPDAELADRKRIIKDAMLKISDKHREVLDLVFFHEMNYQEASEILNVPVNTVKTRVFYAKEALRNAFIQMGVKRDDMQA
jgi:RNA polymerase sigma-70 factor (ECF subfamily)